MNKISPTPWRVIKRKDAVLPIVIDANCKHVLSKTKAAQPGGLDEVMANAQLISLAPDFYRALKWIQDRITQGKEVNIPGFADRINALIERADFPLKANSTDRGLK